MVLDLKILMYQNADEIEKLKKIKADSDQEIELLGTNPIELPKT